MTYEHILVEREDGVGILTLNRPDVLNAMNRKLGVELLDAVKTLEADDAIGCLVVTGAGQALNHLLGQIEKLGYLQRRHEQPGGHAAVYLTKRGWLVVESNVATMRQLEADWQRQLGKERFADLKAALKELSGSVDLTGRDFR